MAKLGYRNLYIIMKMTAAMALSLPLVYQQLSHTPVTARSHAIELRPNTLAGMTD